MKKIVAILITFISTSLYISSSDNQRRYFYTPRKPCCNRLLDERAFGFNNAYRKKVGDAYLRQMIEDQKQEAQDFYNAYLARIQAQSETQQTAQTQEALKIPTQPKLPITPRKTNASCTHLRTPRNAIEIRNLLRIQTILPVIVKTPRMTQFDIQPDHYFYRK